MVLVFTSKCKALLNYLEKTPISMFMIKNEHKLHTYCGRYIAIDVWVHTIFHLLRWYHQGNIKLLWTCAAGICKCVSFVRSFSWGILLCSHHVSLFISMTLYSWSSSSCGYPVDYTINDLLQKDNTIRSQKGIALSVLCFCNWTLLPCSSIGISQRGIHCFCIGILYMSIYIGSDLYNLYDD